MALNFISDPIPQGATMLSTLATTTALATVRAAWLAATDAQRAQRIRDALVWARLTIQRQTAPAERLFAAWISAGRPTAIESVEAPTARYLHGQVNATLRHLASVPDADILAMVADAHAGDGAAEARIAATVPGIGIVKASFALASAGVGRLGCLDSRGIDHHADFLRGHWALAPDADVRAAASRAWGRKAYREGSAYAALVRTLWGEDAADGQWTEWLAGMAAAGRATEHDCLDLLGSGA